MTLLAAVLAAGPGCGDGEPPTAAAGPVDLQISIAGGDDQRGTVGTSLAEPLVVRVTDGVGGVVDVPVAWEVVEGGGQLSLKRGGRTDGQGLAAAVLFLGDQAGEHRISAALGDGDRVLFTAQATSPVDPPLTKATRTGRPRERVLDQAAADRRDPEDDEGERQGDGH